RRSHRSTLFPYTTLFRSSDNFVPLLLNERDEIVSYAHFIEKSIVFVFPDIADKPNFVSELFKTYLPEIVPEIFPFHGEFQWLDRSEEHTSELQSRENLVC